MLKKQYVVPQMGHEINIPSNEIITVVKMICHSEYLNKNLEIRTVFLISNTKKN